MQKQITFILVAFLAALFACSNKENQNYIPKPKGYNRIDLPAQVYQPLKEAHPYFFEYSRAAEVLPDTFKTAGRDWVFIHYPQFKANIQLTYKPLNGSAALLQEYINDAYKLSGKHQIRASSIQEQKYTSKTGKTVTLFKLDGDIPSPYQFYTTDSTKHFLRGAIYLSTATKNDSLAPVIEFVRKDMMQLVNTLQWR